jgi:hypothetical protein
MRFRIMDFIETLEHYSKIKLEKIERRLCRWYATRITQIFYVDCEKRNSNALSV